MTREEPIDDPLQLLWRLLGNVIDSAQYRLKVLQVPILAVITSGLRSVSSIIIQSDIYVNCPIEARGGA